MWHPVLEEEVFRLEIVASQKLIIDQKVEETILELEAQLKSKVLKKKAATAADAADAPNAGAKADTSSSSSSSSDKKKKKKNKKDKKDKNQEQPMTEKEKERADKAAKKAAEKALKENERKLLADKRAEEKQMSKHNSTVTSAATRFLVPITNALNALDSAMGKPGASSMPTMVVDKCKESKTTLDAWMKLCNDVLKAAAKHAGKKKNERLPSLELTASEVTSTCNSATGNANTLAQMLVLASPAK